MHAQLSLPLVIVLLVLVSICHCTNDPQEELKGKRAATLDRLCPSIYRKIFSDDPMDPVSARRLIDTHISRINKTKKEYDIGSLPELDKMMGILQELSGLPDTKDLDCETLYDRILAHRKDKRVLQLYLDDCAQKQAERCPDEYVEFKRKQLK